MNIFNFDERECLDLFYDLVNIDSTTSQYEEIQKYILEYIKNLGFSYELTHKGGLIVNAGGEGNPLCITAHFDDIGLMVRKINNDGTLNVCSVGGLYPFYSVTENVRIYTRDNKIYTGTICRTPASIHVTAEELRTVLGDFRKNVCIVIDEDVKSKADVEKLGITTGDIVALEARPTFVNGYLKSRFIDDKVAVALSLLALKEIKENNLKLNRKLYFYFAAYEEIGHGTSYLPKDVKDMIAIDIAPTGPDQTSDEKKVTIFAKDSRFPYHYVLTNELREAAIKNNINYVIDIFTPHYGTDCDTSIISGFDIRHAAIGFGTANSHGYERTHIEGIKNTYDLLMAYLFN